MVVGRKPPSAQMLLHIQYLIPSCRGCHQTLQLTRSSWCRYAYDSGTQTTRLREDNSISHPNRLRLRDSYFSDSPVRRHGQLILVLSHEQIAGQAFTDDQPEEVDGKLEIAFVIPNLNSNHMKACAWSRHSLAYSPSWSSNPACVPDSTIPESFI